MHVGQTMKPSFAGSGWSDRGHVYPQALPVAWFDRSTRFYFGSELFSRYYEYDPARFSDVCPDQSCLQQQLRSVNSRNLLTLALLRALAAFQASYLKSGDALQLRPLTLDMLAGSINADPCCPIQADSSRLSRLMRHLPVGVLADADIREARDLCPRPRQLHRRYVDAIVRAEQAGLIDQPGRKPLDDAMLAQAIEAEFGDSLSRRTVANIRRDLGIPCSRHRGDNAGYLGATHGFSVLHPLERQVVRSIAPAMGGVYELHTRHLATGPGDVIYIGSTGNLRKRLIDHVRGSGTNACLANHVADGRVWFRFRPVADRWRDTERQLYMAFNQSFGNRPACNRMSP